MKKTFKSKSTVFLMALVVAGLVLFQGSLIAGDPIVSRTGTLQVTSPDGTVQVIGPTDVMPDIVSGSKVEVLDGSVEIAPAEGFIQLVVGGSVATVKAGDDIVASLDPATGKADFDVKTGQVSIVTGNTTATVGAGQHALIGLDKATGIVAVESLAGSIETVTVGVKTVVLPGAIGEMSADAETRNVHIEGIEGPVTVTAIDGTVTTLNTGEVIDTPGSAEGEIQTFEEEGGTIQRIEERRQPIIEDPYQEPSQPLRSEGSPYSVEESQYPGTDLLY